MRAQKAEAGLPLSDDVSASLRRGCEWLKGLIDSQGQIAGSDLGSLYYKVPVALALSGELGTALRTLEWISKHFLGPKGELAIPAEQTAARAYDRGWLVWGASVCGRYDIAIRLAEELRSYQNPSTGGFWETPQALAAGRGIHHAMTAGMAGLGLLSVRHVAEAQRTAEFLIQLLQRQANSKAGVYIAVNSSLAGEQVLPTDPNPSDYVDRQGLKQRPARIGPVQILLLRLWQLQRDPRYLEAAWDYSRLFLDGPPGIYDCVESHKFMWGLAELYQITSDERLPPAVSRIANYIVSQQQPDGQWWGDAIGDGKAGQSLDLRLNTTCNALVGLSYYLHWRM